MKSLVRVAIPLALLCGAIVFVASFWLFQNANWPLVVSLAVAAVLFLVSATAIWLMLDNRSQNQVQFDAYTAEAELKVREAMREVQEIRKKARQITKPQVATLVAQICSDMDVLIAKIRERNPNALQSTATILQNHLVNLEVVIDQYVDIQQQPRYFERPQERLAQGEAAINDFGEFLIKSIRLVERGDAAGYDVALKMLEATKYSALT